MFTKRHYDLMLQFAPDKLLEIYFDLYSYENSGKKVQEIVAKIEDSNHVNKYLNYLFQNDKIPMPNEILSVLNSSGYFLFSKAQTLCLGGLALIYVWYNKIDPYGEETEEVVTKVLVDFIIECNALKLNVSKNFFDKFYNKVIEIADH